MPLENTYKNMKNNIVNQNCKGRKNQLGTTFSDFYTFQLCPKSVCSSHQTTSSTNKKSDKRLQERIQITAVQYQLKDWLIKFINPIWPMSSRNQSSLPRQRPTSLPNKIKIRTCKLPKDFFRGARASSDFMKTSRVSRGSTCDDDSLPPSTPSFRMAEKESKELLRGSRKKETARMMSPIKLVDFLPCRERTQNLRRRVNKEIKDRFIAFELPPIYSNRVSLEL